jgi:hypothetical protein
MMSFEDRVKIRRMILSFTPMRDIVKATGYCYSTIYKMNRNLVRREHLNGTRWNRLSDSEWKKWRRTRWNQQTIRAVINGEQL